MHFNLFVFIYYSPLFICINVINFYLYVIKYY